MLGLAGPVELAPEVALSAGLIALALAWIVLYGLQSGYDSTLGALLRWLHDHTSVKFFGIKLTDPIPFGKIDHWIKGRIGDGMRAVEYGMSGTVHWMEYTWRLTVDSLEWFARETTGAIETLATGTLPAWIDAGTRPLHAAIGALYGELNSLRLEGQALVLRYAHSIEAEMEREFGIAWRGIDAIGKSAAAALESAVHGIEARIASLADYIYHGVSARLGHLERLLAGGLIAAIALEAIGRVWPYFKCGNVRRAARGICRADTAILDLLFGAGIEALLVSDLCGLVTALSAVARKAEPLLLEFVSVENALIGCHGIEAAPLLALPAVTVPAQTTTVALAA